MKLEVHSIIRYVLESMERAPSIEAFIDGTSFTEPIIILNLLDLLEEIRNGSNIKIGLHQPIDTMYPTGNGCFSDVASLF